MTENLQQDGTVDSAALAIPDSAIEVFSANRDDAGRFAAKPADDVLKQADALRNTPPGDNAAPKTEAAAEEEDDYLEIVEEDGKEPSRFKVSEVWEGYRKSKDLQGEIEKFKAQPLLPQEIEQAIVETTRAREQYITGLKRFAAMNQPQVPSTELVNPNSPHYNPEAYYQGVQQYQQALHQQQAVETHLSELEHQQRHEQEAVRAARWQREQAKLKSIWPEVLSDKAAQSEVRGELAKHYGIDDAFLSSELTLDHRIYALAKDALAYRKGQAKQAEAVKVVRAKPKLIRGSARDQQSPTRRQATEARGRLTQSGSLEDAAAALEGLI